MYNPDLKGKKILVIGGGTPSSDLITLAHRNGVRVGVTDYYEKEYTKSIADYAHLVSTIDAEAVAELVRKEQYDGIISQFVDSLIPHVAKQAELLGMYSPFTQEQAKMSTDKAYFKNTCLQYGVPVPREFPIDSADDIDENLEIDFPVIVKPQDGSGSKGISVCHNIEELKKGYITAAGTFRSGKAIVEQYLPFDEINLTYIIQDGDVQLAAVHDRYFNTEQKGVIRVPDLYIYPSRYTDLFLEKYNDKVIRMLKGIGLKNGSLFIQAIVKGEEVYLYEAGMRLNGCKTYQILEVENNYNTFEHLMNYALTGDMGGYTKFDPKFKRWYATWCVVTKPGKTIDRFEGIDELNSYPWLIHIAQRYQPGDTIPANSAGTLAQLTARIHLYGDTREELLERLKITFELFNPIDTNGESVLMPPHSISDVRNRLDYELN